MELVLSSEVAEPLWPAYGWLGLFEFEAPDLGAATDEDALRALVVHARYRDNYIGPQHSFERTTKPEHGPYDLTRLTAAHFARIAYVDMAFELREFLAQAVRHGCTDEARLESAKALTDRFLAASGSSYTLAWRAGLPEHEFGFVLDGSWHELVTIDRTAGHVLDLIGFFD